MNSVLFVGPMLPATNRGLEGLRSVNASAARRASSAAILFISKAWCSRENSLSLTEFSLEHHAFEMNKIAAELARRAADAFTERNPSKPRFVAGSIGPTNKTLFIEPGKEPGSRTYSYDDFVASYT